MNTIKFLQEHLGQNDLTRIKIPYPGGKDLTLNINTGASALVIAPGIGNELVTGKYHDPSGEAPLWVHQDGNAIKINVGNALGYKLPQRYVPKLALSFGRRKPFSLSISTGDMPNDLNLGGIPLSSLAVNFGAGEQKINFSYANPNPMSRMKVAADRGSVQIENIANANSEEIKISGDASHFGLDFSGILKPKTYVCIQTTMSDVEILVPRTTAIKITTEYRHGSYPTEDFVFQDNAYWNGPARNNPDVLLHIHDLATLTPIRWRFV